MSDEWRPQEEMGAFVLGCLDVVFAFSLALERNGLLDRREIADVLTRVAEQSAAQQGSTTSRAAVAQAMLTAFQTPIPTGQARGLKAHGADARSRLRVIDGGRD